MKTVLIIDDDKRLAAALAIRLRAAGYAVLKATDGLEGLKLAADRRPDLVVMDVWMPGGVGILIAQRLKHIGLAGVPVIFLTASKKQDLWWSRSILQADRLLVRRRLRNPALVVIG